MSSEVKRGPKRENARATVVRQDPTQQPGPSVQAILNKETRPVPPALRETRNDYVSEPPPAIERERYFSREFYQLENDKMWCKTWQFVCRAEEIPTVGDHVVYEIADYSLVVVRSSATEIKAFYNVCLHRGRILRETGGHVANLRCKFHGFAWRLDGKLSFVPCRWDFPDLKDEDYSLPEAKVGTWGGFVFINLDRDAMSLEEFLADIPEHFSQWKLEDRYIAAHVGLVIKANWKVALEASLEAMHVLATHPQVLPYMGDANAQYDARKDRPHYSRLICPMGLPSPFVASRVSDQQSFDSFMPPQSYGSEAGKGLKLPPGRTSRQFAAEMMRQRMGQATNGRDFSNVSDSEMLDLIVYSIFPNFYLQGGYFLNTSLFYRYRPWNADPEQCLWEVYVLLPTPQKAPRPVPASLHLLQPDQAFADAEELGPFMGPFLDQDLRNMAWVQKGLRATRRPVSNLARYQESQIQHFHRTLDMYLCGEAINDR
jgi:phenylpropionate dioxygenase-like ring-hydroxylating dioxygenase large terminal subunit